MTTTTGGRTRVNPEPNDDAPPQQRVRLSQVRLSDIFALGGAAVAALCLTGLLYTTLTPFSSAIGFVVVWYLFFLVLYAILTIFDETSQAVRDRLAGVVVMNMCRLKLKSRLFQKQYKYPRCLR